MANNFRSMVVPTGIPEADATLWAFGNELDSSPAGILRMYFLPQVVFSNNQDNDGLNIIDHSAGFKPIGALICTWDSPHVFQYCLPYFDQFTESQIVVRNLWKNSSFKVSLILVGTR